MPRHRSRNLFLFNVRMVKIMAKKKTKGKPDAIDIHVGKRMRVKRIMLGLSQEKLAEHMDLTFQQVQKYERGINRISAGRLWLLAKIFEVPIQFFYDKLDLAGIEVVDVPSSEDAEREKESAKVLKAYFEIKNEDMRKSALNMMKVMAK